MSNEPAQSELRIGQVAKAAGVHVETVRFYERQGLIQQPKKPAMAFRRYPMEIVERIRFIKHAQSLGFTLQEIQDLLSLRADSADACKAVQQCAQNKLAMVRDKIAALQRMETVLAELITTCDQDIPQNHLCPILEVLQQSGDSSLTNPADPLMVKKTGKTS